MSFAWTLSCPTNFKIFLILREDTCFFFLIISLFFIIFCYFTLLLIFTKNILLLLFHYIFFFSWKLFLFFHVPGCSGMFRHVPVCSLFWVLSTAQIADVARRAINLTSLSAEPLPHSVPSPSGLLNIGTVFPMILEILPPVRFLKGLPGLKWLEWGNVKFTGSLLIFFN